MSYGIPIGIEKEMLDAVNRQKVKAEMECIKKVLRELLDREPTNDDAVLCSQKLSDPWDGSYKLSYKGQLLGTVKYIDTPEKFRVEFVPIQKSN